MVVSEHQTLEMYNVLSYRGKMTQQELAIKSQEIEKILADMGAKKNGPVVSATYAVEQGATEAVMDVEILSPLDKEVVVPEGFTWKKHFLLTNALMVRHVGNPMRLSDAINELNNYIVVNGLVPITNGYNVTIKEAKTQQELDEMIIEIYVGISPNIL